MAGRTIHERGQSFLPFCSSRAIVSEQLIFDLVLPASRDGQDFLVTEANRRAVTRLGRPGSWQSGCFLICGPEKSGKSHLADAWARHVGADVVTGVSLATRRNPVGPAGSAIRALCVEDIQAVAGRAELEFALLHVMNFLAEREASLLLTARGRPPDWRPLSPELSSRLAAVSQATIDEPDDELLRGLLAKSIADRQLTCSPSVLEYLVRRIERSFLAADRVVEALDNASLKRRRPITRALASTVLDKPAPDPQPPN